MPCEVCIQLQASSHSVHPLWEVVILKKKKNGVTQVTLTPNRSNCQGDICAETNALMMCMALWPSLGPCPGLSPSLPFLSLLFGGLTTAREEEQVS